MFKNLSDKAIAQFQLEQADRWKKEKLLEKCVSQTASRGFITLWHEH